jgi:hypothetical protein
MSADFDFSRYFFPCDELAQLSSQELRDRIRSHLSMACEEPDGRPEVHSEYIDYAQDIVEQCRDLLLFRNETFTDQEREELTFLSWPLTPQELKLQPLEEEEANHVAHIAQKREREAHLDGQENLLRQSILCEVASEAQEEGLTLTVHGYTYTNGGQDACSVLPLLEYLAREIPQALTCRQKKRMLQLQAEEHFAYGAMFSFEVRVLAEPALWRSLRKWVDPSVSAIFEMWAPSPQGDMRLQRIVTAVVCKAFGDAKYLDMCDVSSAEPVAPKELVAPKESVASVERAVSARSAPRSLLSTFKQKLKARLSWAH